MSNAISALPSLAPGSDSPLALNLTTGSSASSLNAAPKQFESILLSQWLQSAEDTFGSVPGADADQDAGDEQMKSFAVQQLANAFSNSGGIGIAKLVSKALAEKGGKRSQA